MQNNRLVVMPKPKTCSVCCIAMLTNKTFAEAEKLCFDKQPEDYSMDFDAMERALKRAGLNIIRMEEGSTTFSNNALIECRHKIEGYWHYIVYDAEQQSYLDPIPDPPPVSEYEFYRSVVVG